MAVHMHSTERIVWQSTHVVDVRDAVFAARTYCEHRDLRALLAETLGARRVARACEFGAGFGRMTPVLTEFADSVAGFEREPHFVAEAQPLFPNISFHQVEQLYDVPSQDTSFDLILTFTVLQHLVDAVLQRVAAEIKRVLRPGGCLVICEETDTAHRAGDLVNPGGMCTIGRSVSTYQTLLDPLVLARTRRRIIEPTYPRPDVGAYMLFERPL
jgi:SAM-dependent methyltransferase